MYRWMKEKSKECIDEWETKLINIETDGRGCIWILKWMENGIVENIDE